MCPLLLIFWVHVYAVQKYTKPDRTGLTSLSSKTHKTITAHSDGCPCYWISEYLGNKNTYFFTSRMIWSFEIDFFISQTFWSFRINFFTSQMFRSFRSNLFSSRMIWSFEIDFFISQTFWSFRINFFSDQMFWSFRIYNFLCVSETMCWYQIFNGILWLI